ncbi:MAG: hypothetical protein L0Y50_06410 [Beijerinckiaceae bacterium]|nr:hypothetical protein [Beijerinckiaceae bacterium]
MRAGSAAARPAEGFDLTVTAQDRMDRVFGGNTKVAIQLADQKLPDLPGSPVRLFRLQLTAMPSACGGN